MRWLKFILYAVSALLLLVVVSIVVVVIIFDDEEIRDVLIKTVEENSDARLSIAGDFSVKLSLNPTVSVTDIFLHTASGEYDVKIRELTVQASLLSMLSGPVRIKTLRLNDVMVALRYGGKSTATEAVQENQADLENLLPYVDRISLVNLSLRLVNQQAGSERILNIDKLDLARSDTSRFLILRGSGEAAGRVYQLSGKLGLLRSMGDPLTPFPISLTISGKPYIVKIDGVVKQAIQGRGIDLAVEGKVAELADLIDYNPDNSIPLGQVNGSMNIRGNISDIRLEEVRLSLTRGNDIRIELQNNTVNPDTWGEAGLQVKGYINDPQVFNWILPGKLPSFNQATLKATLFRKDQNYTIEDILIQASAADVTESELSGEIGLTGDVSATMLISKMDLALKFSSTKTEIFKPFLFDELPEIGPTSGSLRLLMQSGVLSVKNLKIKVGSEKKLFINAAGQISDIPISGKLVSPVVDLKLIARASSTKELQPVLKRSLPDVQDVRFEGQLTGSSGSWKLDKIDLLAGHTSKVRIKVHGTAWFDDSFNTPDGKAVNLNVQIDASKSRSLSHWAGKSIPSVGPVKAIMHVSGSPDQVLIDKARVEISSKKGFKLVARGKIGVLDLKQEINLQKTDMQLQLSAPSLGSLPGIASYKLPSLGKVSGNAQLSSKGDLYKLDKIVLITGDKNRPEIRIRGQIIDPLKFTGVQLQLEIDAPVYDLLTAYYTPEIQDLGRIKGKLKLSDTHGSLGIYQMNIVAGKQPVYRLKLFGDIGNILGRDERDANIELSIQDWGFIEKLTGKPLPEFSPLSAEGKLFAKVNMSRFDGVLNVGDSVITSKLSIDYSASIPRFNGSIYAPRIYLEDIGVKPETISTMKAEETVEPDNKAPIFSSEPFSLQILNQINGELEVKVDELVGTGSLYYPLKLKLAVNKGVLRAYPAHFSFGKGVVETDFTINAVQTPASYKLKISAEDIDLQLITLQPQSRSAAIKGDVTARIDLAASGDSAQAIASSLDGTIGIVGKNIYLLRTYVELLTRNVLSWTFSSMGLRVKYVKTNCGIIRLTANNGLVTSDLILLDGKDMSLMGELKLDLGNETINMVINPTRKNDIFSKVSPIHIKGPLRDPEVDTLSASEIKSYGGLILLPQVFISLKTLGFLSGAVTDGGKNDQNPCLDITKAGAAASK